MRHRDVIISHLREWVKKSWVKELLMTFAGTTLSILLTFGTAHFVDEKQKRDNGRQTAMMVIHDMEITADKFRSYSKEEEKNSEYATHVLANLNRIDSIAVDTLWLVADYITSSGEKLQYTLDDSSEKIFLSSQEVWKNINNATFIDAVQEFYLRRRSSYSEINNMNFFEKPITDNEYHQYSIEVSDAKGFDDFSDYLKKRINRKNVNYYIVCSYIRQRYFNSFAKEFQNDAERCKFLMGITDQELKQYVESRQRTGKKLREKDLIGSWNLQSSDDHYQVNQFDKNHTYHIKSINNFKYAAYKGHAEIMYIMHGTWELKGDSIIVLINPEVEYSINTEHISYTPDKEQEIQELLETWKDQIEKGRKANMEAGVQRISYFATRDDSGKKIELRRTVKNDQDQDEEITQYLVAKTK